MSDSNQSFERDYERNSRRAHLFGYVLIAGLILELINACIWYKGLETIAEIAAVLLIVGGVWGEIIFGHKARIAGDKQLAEYRARAAEAELQLARLRSPRTPIAPEKRTRIVAALQGYSDIQFDVGIGPNDKDVEDFVWELEPILSAAGWDQVSWRNSAGIVGGLPRGGSGRPLLGQVAASNVSVQIHPGQPTLEAPARALVEILTKIGFAAQMDPFNIHNGNVNAVHVLVGPRR